jgi:hypothetical protein
MALSAGERRMLCFEYIPCLSVVKLGHLACPADQAEITAGVFSMTTRAVAFTLSGIDHPCVISLISLQPFLYVHMTRQTLQLRTSRAKGVAVPALQNALQVLVRLRQGTRRKLRDGNGRQEHGQCGPGQTQTHRQKGPEILKK